MEEESLFNKWKRLMLNGGDVTPAVGITDRPAPGLPNLGELVEKSVVPSLSILNEVDKLAGTDIIPTPSEAAERYGKQLDDEYKKAQEQERQQKNLQLASLTKPKGMAESLIARSGDIIPPPSIPVELPEPSQVDAFKRSVLAPPPVESAPSSQVIDFGENNLDSKDAMRDALLAQKDNTLTANLLKAGDIVGSSIAGTKPHVGQFADSLLEQASAPVKDLKTASEYQKNDPDSAISKGYREAMKRLGIEVKGQASAASLEKIAPWVERVYSADQARKQRAFDAEQNRLLRASMAQERAEERSLAKDQKRQDKIETFTKDFRKEITSGGQKTQYQNMLNGRRAMAFIDDAIKNPNGFKDYGALMTSLKALQGDDSVVREAEIRLGASVGSVIDKIGSYAKQLSSGQKLTENQRKMMMDSVRTLADISKRQYLDAIEPAMQQARDLGIDENKLINLKDSLSTDNKTIVKIRRKSDGVVKHIPAIDAEKILSNSEYERVK